MFRWRCLPELVPAFPLVSSVVDMAGDVGRPLRTALIEGAGRLLCQEGSGWVNGDQERVI